MTSQRNLSFALDPKGNVAIIFAISLAALIPVIFFLIQFRSIETQKYTLQAAADAAAIAVARESSLFNQSDSGLQGIATAHVDANLSTNAAYLSEPRTVTANLLPANSDGNTSALPVIEVSITQLPVTDYQTVFGYPEKTPIFVRARAQQIGQAVNVCVIGLDKRRAETIYLDSNASLSAEGCAIYSNSRHPRGLVANSNSRLKAEKIYSSGGKRGSPSNFSPQPIMDFPAITDPLADRAPPSFGMCDYYKADLDDKDRTISPGVYCGGLRIRGNSNIIAKPGIYIIKGGPLEVDSNSHLTGEGVGFYLTGKNATISFKSNAVVRLSAPETGVMAGLLFFEDRKATRGNKHVITSQYTRYLVGTVYLPKGKFIIDADMPIADQSEFTAIVARQIELNSSPVLVLNTDYHLTSVPVPDGLGPQTTSARLIE